MRGVTDKRDRLDADLVEPEGVNAGSADVTAEAEGAAAPPHGDVLGGGAAERGPEQQPTDQSPSPLGGAPWTDPARPYGKEHSGDR